MTSRADLRCIQCQCQLDNVTGPKICCRTHEKIQRRNERVFQYVSLWHCTNNTYLGFREREGRVPRSRRVPQRWTKAEGSLLSLFFSLSLSLSPSLPPPPRTISILLRCITCLFTATRSNFLLAVLLALIKMEGERERERSKEDLPLLYLYISVPQKPSLRQYTGPLRKDIHHSQVAKMNYRESLTQGRKESEL